MFLKLTKCVTFFFTIVVGVWVFIHYAILWPKFLKSNIIPKFVTEPRKLHSLENEYTNMDNSSRLYVITPTYPRSTQMVEMVRLAQTLMLVNNVCWIVVEDTTRPSEELVNYLESTPINFVYLTAQMPSKYRNLINQRQPRGVANRLVGLEWIRKNVHNGVFYFADDDNTYDIHLFNDIRDTKKVSMFPVGFVGKYGLSSPIIKNGKVTGFFDSWIGARKYAIDMAGFAVNIKFFEQFPNATMPYKIGYEEDGFLRSLNLSFNDIEPKAINCTKIWAWHTQTRKPKPVVQPDHKYIKKIENSNIPEMLNKIHYDGKKELLPKTSKTESTDSSDHRK